MIKLGYLTSLSVVSAVIFSTYLVHMDIILKRRIEFLTSIYLTMLPYILGISLIMYNINTLPFWHSVIYGIINFTIAFVGSWSAFSYVSRK